MIKNTTVHDTKYEHKLLYGKPVADHVYACIESDLKQLRSQNITPCLRVLLVGDNPASQIYTRIKAKRGTELGMDGEVLHMPSTTTTAQVERIIIKLNQDPSVHGILVQLPLPAHIDEQNIIPLISPEKDVDGLHEVNIGRLQKQNPHGYVPCTAAAVIKFFEYYRIDTQKRHVVIVGRSEIVGRPLANLLSLKNNKGNATVTLCHSQTKDISMYTRMADIVIAAIGVPHFIKENMVSDNAVIIDVGINRIDSPSQHTQKYQMVGDVDIDSVIRKVAYVTPVPNGVGPVTIAMLMYNTIHATKRMNSL